MKLERPKSKQPIPGHARKVFDGVVFNVYQWDQEMYDGTIRTFEKVQCRDGVNIIAVTRDKKIILTHQTQPGVDPFVGIVGGHIDDSESPLQAAKRELLEETGYMSNNWVEFFSRQPIPRMDFAIYNFIAKDCVPVKAKKILNHSQELIGHRGKAPRTVENGSEKIKLVFASFEEFVRVITDEDYRDREITLKLLCARESSTDWENLKMLILE